MAVDEQSRSELWEALVRTVGQRPAETLMSWQPPRDWSEFASGRDLDDLGVALRSEMTELRGELRSEMTELRGELRSEMTELRGELRSEMTELRTDLRVEMEALDHRLAGQMTELRADFRTEMAALNVALRDRLDTQLRWMLTLVVALAAAVFASNLAL